MHHLERCSLRAILTGSLVTWSLGCGSTQPASSELATREAGLLARSGALWPVVDGVARVSVCWRPAQLQTTYPVASLRPDLQALLPERKRWVQESVEEQWNARTALKFTGWHDCSAAPADVELTPIDSGVTSSCAGDNLGQSCVEALGSELAGGGGVFVNLFFGEEALYSSRYQQASPGRLYDERNEPNYDRDYSYWLPQACVEEFEYAWSTNNTLTRYPLDIDAPEVLAAFMAIYESCLKFNALHEFGHIAGFSHEQQRADVPPTCDAERDPDVQYLGDTPLGPFDTQSIMSYCRTDDTATLTEQDVEQTNRVYLANAPDADIGGETPDTDLGAAGDNDAHGNDADSDDASNDAPAASDGMSGAPGTDEPSVAPRDDAADDSAAAGDVAAANGGQATAATSLDAAPTTTDDPNVSSTHERQSRAGCAIAIPSAHNAYAPALALAALLAAARSRRARAPLFVAHASPEGGLRGWAAGRRGTPPRRAPERK